MPPHLNFLFYFLCFWDRKQNIFRDYEKMVLETKIPGTFKDILTNTVAALLVGKQTKLQKHGDRY